jgi:hypothetical protein
LAAWVAVSLFAPTASAAEQPLRFTVFASQPLQGLGYVPRPGGAVTKVTLYPTARSPRYEYRGAMPLRFTDGNSSAVVAEASVPPDLHDVLLLISPIEATAADSKKNATPLKYRVAVLDDSAASHASGGLTIINFSGLALSGTIDGKPVTLQDGLNPPIPLSKTAPILLTTPLKGRPHQSYVGEVKLKKNERALLILFPPFYKGSLEVQSRLLIDEPPARPTGK